MTHYGQRENGRGPFKSILELLTDGHEDHDGPVELRARLDGDPDDDLVWKPVPPGEGFPWMFADRDSKIPNVLAVTWTTTPPTEPGWYWARQDGACVVMVYVEPWARRGLVARIYDDHVGAPEGEPGFPLSAFSGWIGPLVPPDEP